MATVKTRKVYDKPLGSPFGTARLYAFAQLVDDASGADTAGTVSMFYGVAVDTADPPANFVQMDREDFLAIRLLRNLAVP